MTDTTPLADLETNAGELAQQLYNQPLFANEHVAGYLRYLAGHRFRLPALTEQDMAFYPMRYGEERKPYQFKDGIATLSVRGMLAHRSNAYWSFMTGYDALKARFDYAQEDPDVRGILWDFNSGGGMVSGLLDFADHVYNARGSKPMWGVVNDGAYSAAYAIASSVDKLYVTRTGGVGSIGALAVLVNFSKLFAEVGIEAKIIRSAPRKAKPNAMEPWEEIDLQRVQDSIDHSAAMFIDLVARNRNITEQAIRATDAAALSAEEGLEIGLVDGIQSVDATLEQFQTELSGSHFNGGVTMTTQNPQHQAGAQPGETPNQPARGFTQAQLDEAKAAAHKEGEQAGAKAENERVFGILEMEEAKGRGPTAIALAKNPANDVESAKGVLLSTPEAKPEAGNSLDDWMQDTGGGANVPGAESPEGEQAPQAAQINHADIFARRNKALAGQ